MSEIPEQRIAQPLPRPKLPFRLNIKTVALLLPTVVAIGAAVFFYVQLREIRQTANLTGDKQAQADVRAEQKEIKSIEEQLGEVILLPQGEIPTLITIKDKDEINENKEFLSEAENGDVVLVYQQAKKAYLYRPITKKLINLAPIDLAPVINSQEEDEAESGSDDSEELAPIVSPEVQEPVTVELRNGTSKQGLTFDFEQKLSGVFEQVGEIDRESASRDDYEESVMVVVNITKKSMAQRVANELGLTLVELPSDEPKSGSDILIILGADQL